MDRWLDTLARGGVTSFGGVGIVVVLLLVAAVAWLRPGGKRGQAALPAGFLVLHVLVVALRAVFDPGADAQRPLRVAAVFLLLAAAGRAGFLLAIDWLLVDRLRRPLSKIFRDIIHVLVYFLVAIVTLREMGVDPSSLLTTSALLTAVIGLSLQETLGNLFAGLAMEAQRPFDVGDWVQFDSDPTHVGRVIEINWRATKIQTNDQIEVIVPNGVLAKAPIVNFSQPTRVSRRLVRVQVAYEAPPRRVQDVLVSAAVGAPGVLPDPAPFALTASFADSGIEYWLHYFVDDFERRNPIDSEVRVRVWYALKRAGLSIPFPVRDVRTRDVRADEERAVLTRIAAREKALHSVDFLDVLPKDQIEELARRVRTRLYTAGETVIQQGDAGDELFIILDGEVAVMLDKGGRDVEVARLRAGKFFGEMSLMTGETRAATVRATGECELLVVGHDAFHDVLVAAPELAERISEVLARRQAQLEERASNPSEAPGQDPARKGVLLKRIKEFFSL